jgi:hypothetical protein
MARARLSIAALVSSRACFGHLLTNDGCKERRPKFWIIPRIVSQALQRGLYLGRGGARHLLARAAR